MPSVDPRTMMNAIFALIAFVFCVTASAQNSVQEWQAEAIKKYPALGIQGSAFNNAFVAEYERRKQAGDEMLRAANWPMRIAILVQIDLSAADMNAASSRARSDAPTPAPAVASQPGSQRGKGDNADGLNFSLTPADLEKMTAETRKTAAERAPEMEAQLLESRKYWAAVDKRDAAKTANTLGQAKREGFFDSGPAAKSASVSGSPKWVPPEVSGLDAEKRQVRESLAVEKRAEEESRRSAALTALAVVALAFIVLSVRGGNLKQWFTRDAFFRESAPPLTADATKTSWTTKVLGYIEGNIPMQNDPQPTAAAKARQIPRKRERLRAFVALTQEKVVWIGIFLLIASWMMPPWVERRDGEFYGFHCALSHPYHDRESIDFGRLALIDLTILTLAAGAAWQLRKRT